MTICTDHESEVCYESRNCPACEIQQELNEAKKYALNDITLLRGIVGRMGI